MAMIPWWAWSILASGCAVQVEWVNRSHPDASYLGVVLPRTIVAIVFMQYGLYQAWSRAPQLLIAWATFFVVTASFRILLVTLVLREDYTVWGWAGYAGLLAGAAALHLGRP